MAATYQIEDEPRPRPLAHTAVRPLWPLFAVMFGGAWMAWPWFLWNGWVVGSPTWRRELAWVVGGVLGFFGLAFFYGLLTRLGVVDRSQAAYAMLAFTLWKLGVTYALFSLQARTFQIYEHYGGVVRNGVLGVLLAFLIRPRILEAFPWLAIF